MSARMQDKTKFHKLFFKISTFPYSHSGCILLFLGGNIAFVKLCALESSPLDYVPSVDFHTFVKISHCGSVSRVVAQGKNSGSDIEDHCACTVSRHRS